MLEESRFAMKEKIIGIIVRQGEPPERVEVEISPSEETVDQMAREMDKHFHDGDAEVWKGVPYDQMSEASKLYRKEFARIAWLMGARPAKITAPTRECKPLGCPNHNCPSEE
jgi:hypothetical protein